MTLIAWGAMLHETMQVAEQLEAEGVDAEVIDVATLKPYDANTLIQSVEKTGRCVIVHEAPRTAGFGAEIAAEISERALYSLLAPVKRVTGYDVVVPLSRLEKQYIPDARRIISAVREVMEAS